MSSVNKVILIGNLGADPEVKALANGTKLANLRLATSKRWTDKNTGEKREKTTWHRLTVFSPKLVEVAERFLRKGSKIYVEGELDNREYEKDGTKVTVTEVRLDGFNCQLTMLDGKPAGGEGFAATPQKKPAAKPQYEFDDEIPFGD